MRIYIWLLVLNQRYTPSFWCRRTRPIALCGGCYVKKISGDGEQVMADRANAYRIAKKKKERGVIEVAHRTSEIIPAGEILDFDEPDFKLETPNGFVGI